MACLDLTVVGSSDAFNAAGRAHSCYLLEPHDEALGPVMIDFGATSLMALRRLGRRPSDIAAFAFTHLHGDHIGGFPFLAIDGMFNEPRSQVMKILGPVGVQARLEALLSVTYGDILDRPRPFELDYRELLPGGEATLTGLAVQGFPADHMDPPEQPLCLRFTVPSPQGDKVVAFSGDTRLGDGLMAAADGVDLLVAECSGLKHPIGRHCAWEDWLTYLPQCTAKRVVFSHLGAAVRAARERLLDEVPAGSPPVTFADDGLSLTL